MPAVEPGVPRGRGRRAHAHELAAGETGLEPADQTAGEAAAGEERQHGGQRDGDDPGVAGGPGGPRRRQHLEVHGLVGDGAALERLDGRVGALGRVGVEEDLVVDEVGGMTQGSAGAHEEAGDVTSAEGAPAAGPPACRHDPPRVEDGSDVTELSPGRARLLGEEEHDAGGRGRSARSRPRAGAPRRARSGSGPRAARTGGGTRRSRARGCAGAHGGPRHHDDPAPGLVGTPREVDVAAEVAEGGIVAAEGLQELPFEQQARERHGEDVGAPVVLALVGLARDGRGMTRPERVSWRPTESGPPAGPSAAPSGRPLRRTASGGRRRGRRARAWGSGAESEVSSHRCSTESSEGGLPSAARPRCRASPRVPSPGTVT